MSRLYGLHPLIVDAITASDELDDFVVWARSGDGKWADLFDMKEFIHVNVWLDTKQDCVMAEVVATVQGFGGVIKGNALCIPNCHLQTEIMQVLTILEFLPRNDNINDHTSKVHLRWLREERDRRDKEIDEIHASLVEDVSFLPDEEVEAFVRDCCGTYGISLENYTSAEIFTEADALLKRVARKIRKERKEG